jgi:hypothetical protein
MLTSLPAPNPGIKSSGTASQSQNDTQPPPIKRPMSLPSATGALESRTTAITGLGSDVDTFSLKFGRPVSPAEQVGAPLAIQSSKGRLMLQLDDHRGQHAIPVGSVPFCGLSET